MLEFTYECGYSAIDMVPATLSAILKEVVEKTGAVGVCTLGVPDSDRPGEIKIIKYVPSIYCDIFDKLT